MTLGVAIAPFNNSNTSWTDGKQRLLSILETMALPAVESKLAASEAAINHGDREHWDIGGKAATDTVTDFILK